MTLLRPWLALLSALLFVSSVGGARSAGNASGLIAFTRGNHGYLMNSDGSGIRELSCGDGVNELAWSPDGRRLACGGVRGIVVVNADGSGATRVSTRGIQSLSWSPDGRIAFTWFHRAGFKLPNGKPAYTSDIAVMSADGGNVRQLTRTPKLWESNVDWSPAGGRIAFERASGMWVGHVYVMNSDGSGVRDLNPARRQRFQQPWQTPYKVFSGTPDWSPDGKRIAFSYYDPYPALSDIWIMNADGKGLVKLTANWANDDAPSWSSDGQRLAFVRSARNVFTKSAIVTMHADGSGQRTITGGEFDDRNPAWQPLPSAY